MKVLIQRYLMGAMLCLIALSATPARAESVTDEAQATEMFKRAYSIMAELGLPIVRDILLKFRTRDELNTENISAGGRAIELNGFYRPYNPESVWIVSGLSYNETLATMAHELTHAWQSTESPQQDRKLTEGFATWVQYHVLEKIDAHDEAARLKASPDPDYGGGLRFLLDLEQKEGVPAVVKYARTERNIP